MKRIFLYFIPVFLIATGVFLFLRFGGILTKGKGGLLVTANIKSNVYLNGTFIGQTKLCKGCDPNKKDAIPEGNYLVKIEPLDKTYPPFSYRMDIKAGLLTDVDRVFLPDTYSSAYILTLDKIAQKDSQIEVHSIPDKALVFMNGNLQGATPLVLQNLTASSYTLELQKQGYGKKTIFLQTIPSYKIVVESLLGTEPLENIHPSPTPTPTLSAKGGVLIKQTSTGFLRVRDQPGLNGNEITQVTPGNTFPLLDEKNGWYKIQLPDGTTGWISGDFAQKTTGQ